MKKLTSDWLSALRSDRYEQAQGYLKIQDNDDNGGDAYCCLGILCDIYSARGGRWDDNLYGGFNDTFRYGGKRYDTMPPEKVVEASGITMAQAHILAGMNDRHETFRDIADTIEAMVAGTWKDAEYE